MPEAVSPELVLVDPELARRERARLTEKARLVSMLESDASPAAVERDVHVPVDDTGSTFRRDAAEFARRKVLPVALMGSLLANGFFAAELVARADKQDGAAAVPLAARPAGPTGTGPVASPSVGRGSRHTSSLRLTKKASVERKLVAVILAAPARKLPRAFIDPKTGLVRNNVHVICRPSKRSYLCTVGLSADGASGQTSVRYRLSGTGKGTFTWYGYKRG